MEYHKATKLLDNTSNQPSKFRTKNWIEINDDSRGMYNTNSQTKFKNLMLNSSLCNYSEGDNNSYWNRRRRKCKRSRRKK